MQSPSDPARRDLPAPLAPDAPLPHRKTIRAWLLPIAQRSTLRACVLLAFDLALFAALIAATVLLPAWWLKLPCALAAGGFWLPAALPW